MIIREFNEKLTISERDNIVKNEMDIKKFTDCALSIDISEVSRCILCHDPVCTKACPQKAPVGDILRSMYFDNFLGAIGTSRRVMHKL